MHPDDRRGDEEDLAPEPGWPVPVGAEQYGVEGTLERLGAFAAGARLAEGRRGVLARVGSVLVLTGLLGGVVLSAWQAVELLVGR